MGRYIWFSAILGGTVFWGVAGWAYVDSSRKRTWTKVVTRGSAKAR